MWDSFLGSNVFAIISVILGICLAIWIAWLLAVYTNVALNGVLKLILKDKYAISETRFLKLQIPLTVVVIVLFALVYINR